MLEETNQIPAWKKHRPRLKKHPAGCEKLIVETLPERETIMAEGGDKSDGNPFSFKNFSKKKPSLDSAQGAKDEGNVEDGNVSDSEGETRQKADRNGARHVEGK